MKLRSLIAAAACLLSGTLAQAQNPWTTSPTPYMGKVFRIQSAFSKKFLTASGIDVYTLKMDYNNLDRDNCQVVQSDAPSGAYLQDWYIMPLGELSDGVAIVNAKTGLALGISAAFRKELNKPPVWDPKLRRKKENADLLLVTFRWGKSWPEEQKGNWPESFSQVWEILDAGNGNVRFKIKGGDVFLNVSGIGPNQNFDDRTKDHRGENNLFNAFPDLGTGNPHGDPIFQTFTLVARDYKLPAFPANANRLNVPTQPRLTSPDLQDEKANPRKSEEVLKGYTVIPALFGVQVTPAEIKTSPWRLLERRVQYVRDDEVSADNGLSTQRDAMERTIATGATDIRRTEFSAKLGFSLSVSADTGILPGGGVTAEMNTELGYSSANEMQRTWTSSFTKKYGPYPAKTTVAYYHLTEIYLLKRVQGNLWVDVPSSRYEVATKADLSREFEHK